MSDEFDRLRDAIRQATPEPNPNRKANDIARAMENFDREQLVDQLEQLMSGMGQEPLCES